MSKPTEYELKERARAFLTLSYDARMAEVLGASAMELRQLLAGLLLLQQEILEWVNDDEDDL